MSSTKLGIGDVVDSRYRIERVLGEGGMGAVFVAEHLRLQKPVALKVVHASFAGNAELAERFAREAMVSAKLEHPHVASAIDYGTLADGSAYLVMQLARGKNLRAWIDLGPDWKLAVRVGAQVADALAVAHAHGVVHRDLKPENVVVDDQLHARVLDFGIARVADAGGSALTRVGTVMGTPGYMPPEQAVGEPVDTRADVYALGVMLFEICTGELPFPQDELGKILAAQLTADAPRLATRASGVPPELDALVASMLTSSKHARPADVAPIRDALRTMTHALGPSTAVGAQSGTVPRGSVSREEEASGTVATPSRDGATVAMPSSPDASATVASNPGALGSVPAATVASSPDVGATVTTPAPFGATSPPAVAARDSQPVAFAPTMIATAPPSKPAPALPKSAFVAMGALTVLVVSCLGVRSACGGDETEAVTAVATPGGLGPIGDVPGELATDVATLVTSPDAATRSGAAARLMPEQGRLPAFVRMLLAVETSADCDDRRDAVRALRVLGDPRALPALLRVQRADDRDDRCLRRDLRRAIERLTP
ncbi:MAG: protein kinase [Polyangiales bacterium]